MKSRFQELGEEYTKAIKSYNDWFFSLTITQQKEIYQHVNPLLAALANYKVVAVIEQLRNDKALAEWYGINL